MYFVRLAGKQQERRDPQLSQNWPKFVQLVDRTVVRKCEVIKWVKEILPPFGVCSGSKWIHRNEQ